MLAAGAVVTWFVWPQSGPAKPPAVGIATVRGGTLFQVAGGFREGVIRRLFSLWPLQRFWGPGRIATRPTARKPRPAPRRGTAPPKTARRRPPKRARPQRAKGARAHRRDRRLQSERARLFESAMPAGLHVRARGSVRMVWPRGALRPGRRPSRPRGRRLRGRLHRRRIRRQFEPDGARGIVQVHLRFRTRICTDPMVAVFGDNQCVPANHVAREDLRLHPRVELDVQRRWPVRRSHVAPATHRRRFVRAGGRAERASDASVGAHGAHLRVQTSAGCGGLPRTRGLRGPADVGVPGQTLCLEERRNGLHRVVGYSLPHVYYAGLLDTRGCSLRHLWVRLTRERVVLADRRHDVHHVRLPGTGWNLPNLAVGHCNVVGSGQIGMKTSVSGGAQSDFPGSAASTGSVSPDPSMAVTVCCSQ